MATQTATELSMQRVREFWEQVVQHGNFNMITSDYIGPGYRFNGEPQSPAQLRKFATKLWEAYDQRTLEIHQVVGFEDRVGIWWTFTGVAKGTNKLYTTSAMNVIQVKDLAAHDVVQAGSLTLDGS